MQTCANFTGLTPDRIIDAVETAIDTPMSGFTHPLNSYINRVYELQCLDGTRIIGKFYRPGRWTLAALQDEHTFMNQCTEQEIPVVPPMLLQNGTTIDSVDNIYFALFPKRRGREFEPLDDEAWIRMGSIIGRIHAVGQLSVAKHRVKMHPLHSTINDINYLLNSSLVTPKYYNIFKELTTEIMDIITPLFKGKELIRIHGDCHCGNILERPGEGLMAIDFDDMAMGVPVQDLWMLLPDHLENCRVEMNLILEGYEIFREFDDSSLKLVEPLRIMRILYFTAWCSKQIEDPNFLLKFPNWGSDNFWNKETNDLQQQLNVIKNTL